MKWHIQIGWKKLVLILPQVFSSEKVFEAEFEGKIIYFRFDQNQNILLYQYKKSKLWKVVRIRKAFCSSLDYMPSGQVSLAYEHFGILTEVRSEISPFSKVVSASEKINNQTYRQPYALRLQGLC